MDLARKIFDIDLEHDLGLNYQELDHVKQHLTTVKASFQTDEEWLSAITGAMMAFRHDALAKDSKESGAPKCLVCGENTEKASIDGSTPVWYCKPHRVIIPTVKQA